MCIVPIITNTHFLAYYFFLFSLFSLSSNENAGILEGFGPRRPHSAVFQLFGVFGLSGVAI